MSPLNPLRHQLTSTSPVRLRGLVAAAATNLARPGTDPRERLAEVLREEQVVAGALLTGSGTEAVVLALEAAATLRRKTTTVVLPAFSCFDLAAAAVRFRRPIVFYDVDPNTLGPDPESLRAAVAEGHCTVVVASLFGIPIDWDTLDPILEESESFVVEDAAQGHGARWRDAPLGGHGRLGVLSFGRGKGWTGGAGGALLIRDEADRAALSDLVLTTPAGKTGLLLKAAAHWSLGRPTLYGLPRAVPGLGLGETRYRDVGAPRAMAPFAARLALDGKPAADAAVTFRREAAARYQQFLRDAGIPAGVPEVSKAGVAGYVRFPVLLPDGMDTFTDPRRASSLGAARSYPAALPTLAQVRVLMTADRPTGPAAWPGARTLVEQLVTLPTHELTTTTERDGLVDLLSNDR